MNSKNECTQIPQNEVKDSNNVNEHYLKMLGQNIAS